MSSIIVSSPEIFSRAAVLPGRESLLQDIAMTPAHRQYLVLSPMYICLGETITVQRAVKLG
jgi:hypothetical protein